ncbi:hypothetical protein M0R04_04690 [Candidatus Dojkabacteria bacterium]|jgi:hypothetical protein|nr:hypothetical protein [Candidatus Dojkabacteria bacterium]
MNMQMSIDINGNKIVKITFPGKGIKGFSIQTNGNLPLTHDTNVPNFNEILNYTLKFGTKREKQIIYD